jgi:hypothetical protein
MEAYTLANKANNLEFSKKWNVNFALYVLIFSMHTPSFAKTDIFLAYVKIQKKNIQ